MKKSVCKKTVAIALLASMAVAMPLTVSAQETAPQVVRAASTGTTYYAVGGAKGSGTSERDPGDFQTLLGKVQDGDTICLKGINVDRSTDSLVIDKAITIIGEGTDASLSVRSGNIELGADVTFKNIDLDFGHYPVGILDLSSKKERNAVAIYASGHYLTMTDVRIPVFDSGYRILPTLVGGPKPGGKVKKTGECATINLIDPNGKLNVRYIYGAVGSGVDVSGIGSAWDGSVGVLLNGRPTIYGTAEVEQSNGTLLQEKTLGVISAGTGVTRLFVTTNASPRVDQINASKAADSLVHYHDSSSTNLPEITGVEQLFLDDGTYRVKHSTIDADELHLNNAMLDMTIQVPTTLTGNLISGNKEVVAMNGGTLRLPQNGQFIIGGAVTTNASTTVKILGDVQANHPYITANTLKENAFIHADSKRPANVVNNEWQFDALPQEPEDVHTFTSFTIQNPQSVFLQSDFVVDVIPGGMPDGQDELVPSLINIGTITAYDQNGAIMPIDYSDFGLPAWDEDVYDSQNSTVVYDENGQIAHIEVDIDENQVLKIQRCVGNKNSALCVNSQTSCEIKPGTYTIKFRGIDGQTFPNYAFTVVEKEGDQIPEIEAESVTLNAKTIWLEQGASQLLRATVIPSNAAVVWSSNNPEIATVDANGNVTAVALGSTTIVAKAKAGTGTDSCQVVVESKGTQLSPDTAVTGITLSQANVSLKTGSTATLTATVEGGANADKTVTWTSGDPDTVSVDASGKVTARKSGTVLVTAMSNADPSVTATCAVMVDQENVVTPNADGSMSGTGLKQLITEALKDSPTSPTVELLVNQTEKLAVEVTGDFTKQLENVQDITFAVNNADSNYEVTYTKADVGKSTLLGLGMNIEQLPAENKIDITVFNLEQGIAPRLRFGVAQEFAGAKFKLYHNGEPAGDTVYTATAVLAANTLDSVQLLAAAKQAYVEVALTNGNGTYTLVMQNTGGTENPGTPETPTTPGGTTSRPTHNKRPSTTRPTTPETPITTPTTPSTNQVPLDTQTVNMARGGRYSFLVKGNHDVANLRVSSADPSIATVELEDANDPRGARYRVTAVGTGTTQILVAYQGKTSSMAVQARAVKGSMTLDTSQYRMAPGNTYTIGAFVRDENGNLLGADKVRGLIANGQLKVKDSRTGSVVDLEQLPSGHFQVTGKHEGTAYIIYEMGGNHASVRVDVQKGVTQGGSAVRNTSYFV